MSKNNNRVRRERGSILWVMVLFIGTFTAVFYLLHGGAPPQLDRVVTDLRHAADKLLSSTQQSAWRAGQVPALDSSSNPMQRLGAATRANVDQIGGALGDK